MSESIRWVRILIGGVLAEVAVIAIVLPIGFRYGQAGLSYSAAPASFVMCFIAAWVVARRLESKFVLHGVLVGVVATLIYVLLSRGQPERLAYILAHGLRLVGGALGGWVASTRRASRASAGHAM